MSEDGFIDWTDFKHSSSVSIVDSVNNVSEDGFTDWADFKHSSSVSIVDFEQVNAC